MSSHGHRALLAIGERGDRELREIVELARGLCDVEAAGVTVIADDDLHLVATSGFDPLVVDLSHVVHRLTLDDPETIVIPDASQVPELRHNRYVDGTDASLRTYVSAPVSAPDGTVIGRLALLDHEVKHLSTLQLHTVAAFADHISRLVEVRLLQEEGDLHPSSTEDAVRVAAQISHDMRVPLTALTSSLDLLHETVSDGPAPAARLLATARRSTRRIALMVEALLRLNEAGRRLRLSDVDLQSLVEQVTIDTRPLLEAAGGSVEAAGLPSVTADADLLYSVLLNLVTNAAKFRRDGVPLRVVVTARTVGDGWRIEVGDNGTGIPVERREQVFSMFARLDTRVEGSGIGLATVQRIVRTHGGQVGITDGPDGGTTVWFELPSDPAVPAGPSAAGMPAVTSAPIVPSARPAPGTSDGVDPDRS